MAAARAGNLSTWEKFYQAFRGWYINASGYRKYGVRADDLLSELHPEVVEAISRLPDEEQMLRIFRLKRLQDLSLKHQILPQEEWTKPEEDVPYLRPLVKMVLEEYKERKAWDRK